MKIDFRVERDFYCLPSNARICCGLLLCGLLGGMAAFGEHAAALQRPKLTPQPREMRLGQSFPLRSMVIVVPGGDAEDSFTAQCLTKNIAGRGLAVSPAMGSTDITVELLRADSAEAKRLLAREKLTFDAAMHDEGYVFVSRAGLVAFIGETAAGVFYGAQTLKQMIANGGDARRIRNGTIRDWPAMKYRGVHDDLSRGPFPTLAFQEHQLEIFAEHKINLYSLTRAEAQELTASARRLHIIVVPDRRLSDICIIYFSMKNILTWQKHPMDM